MKCINLHIINVNFIEKMIPQLCQCYIFYVIISFVIYFYFLTIYFV